MAVHRLSWLLSILCSLAFVTLYQKWLSWLVLAAVLLVPLCSLLISLPAMLSARVTVRVPRRIEKDRKVEPEITCKGWLPEPLWRCRVEVTNGLTGQTLRLSPGSYLPTHHCGALRCRLKRARICDYLGIFALPLRGEKEFTVLVEPPLVPMEEERVLRGEQITRWKPKAGGFAENHELRLYRPGDSLRQIHWKLSAKTGKLILREPMVPDPGEVPVRLVLRGTGTELDRMLGRFLWLGEQLLAGGVPFLLQCLTGEGLMEVFVQTQGALRQCLERMLESSPVREGSLPTVGEGTQACEIGGEPDEP